MSMWVTHNRTALFIIVDITPDELFMALRTHFIKVEATQEKLDNIPRRARVVRVLINKDTNKRLIINIKKQTYENYNIYQKP